MGPNGSEFTPPGAPEAGTPPPKPPPSGEAPDTGREQAEPRQNEQADARAQGAEEPKTPPNEAPAIEDDKNKEKGPSSTVQNEEINSLTNTIINTKGRELEDKVDRDGKDSITAEEAAFLTLHKIRGWAKGMDPLTMTGLEVEGIGKVTAFSVAENGRLNCFIEGTETPVTDVDRALVENAQLKSSRDEILRNFSGAQKEIVYLWIKSTENPDSYVLEGKTPDQINNMINEAAENTPRLTTRDFIRVISNMPNGQERNQIIDMLGRRNLIDATTASRIFQSVDTGSGALRQEIGALEEHFMNAQKAGLDTKELRREIAVAREILTVQETASKLLKGDRLTQYFKGMEDGINPNSDAFKNAVRSGNINEATKSIFPEIADDPSDTPEMRADKKLKREDAEKKMKTMGWLSLAVLLMAGMAVGELSKNIGK